MGSICWISTTRENELAYCHTCMRISAGKFENKAKVLSSGKSYAGTVHLLKMRIRDLCSRSHAG